jgi:hypothetical protein
MKERGERVLNLRARTVQYAVATDAFTTIGEGG